MRKEIIETAKTVEEAISSACEKLACDRDEVQFEIINLPKKTFLGLKIIPAKVRVWVEGEEPVAAPKREKPQPQQRTEKPQPKKQEKPREKVEPPKVEQPAQPKEKRPVAEPLPEELAAKADAARNYLRQVCEDMGLQAEFHVRSEDGGICIEVEGQGLGAIIGRRGETLDALQYLSGLVANRLEGEYLRVTVDCGDYRTKRKATLEALAKKLSAQVLKTNISKTLEPMNPFERRIIHATVSEIEGVSSTSIGEEPNRRVVITSPTAKRGGGRERSASAPRSGNRVGNSSGGGRDRDRDRSRPRGGRGGPPPRPDRSSTQGGSINTLPQNRSLEPKKTPEAASSDKPLYTKLDLE